MEITNQPKLTFNGVDFAEVIFKATDFYKAKENTIDINIEPKLAIDKKNKNNFQVLMEVELSCKDCFVLKLLGIGHFQMEGNLDKKTRDSFLHINAAPIMFPYVRSFISTLTGNLGNIIGSLTIPPQFFNGKLDEIKE